MAVYKGFLINKIISEKTVYLIYCGIEFAYSIF